MNFFEFPETIQFWVRDLLVWVGYGTIVGLLAKAIMPGRDPGGTIATLAMGIAGVIIGCGVATMFLEGKTVTPISPPGLCFGTAGAFVLLLFYRILGGYWFETGDTGRTRRRRRVYRRRRVAYDD